MNDLENIINIDNNPTAEEIFTHLSFISDLLTENQIKHWISYGTLLGCIRDKNIIPYDYDFDLGVIYQDVEKILNLNHTTKIKESKYFLEKGFGVVYNTSNTKMSEYKWRVSIKVKYNDLPVGDLYVYLECEDGFMRRYDPKEGIYYWPNSTFPKFFIENLTYNIIRDRLFPCPVCPEVLVEHLYGPLWTIPIRAMSQNGSNHSDYDYYGNYKYNSLSFLIKWLEENKNIKVVPNLGDIVSYFFPLDQIDWLKQNDPLKFNSNLKK